MRVQRERANENIVYFGRRHHVVASRLASLSQTKGQQTEKPEAAAAAHLK